MADAPDAPAWGTEWIEANQRYWDAWTNLWPPSSVPSSSAADAPTIPWAEALEQWRKLMSPPTPPSSRELMEHLMEQGKAFLRFAQALSSSAARPGSAFQSPDEWRLALRAIAESWQAGFARPAGDGGFAAFWNLPFDTWSRTVSTASVFPGDFLESHKPETWGKFADGLHRDLERFLSVPALGYTREVQEQGQEMVRLALEYHRALQAYGMAFRDLGMDALNRLQRRLAERREPITTLRGLYDLWVDCSEEAYLELVSTDSYAEVYGRMVNALMALKHHGRNMVDEVVGAMGMPTRHGLNTLQQRQQELRREVVALRRELAVVRSVQGELAELRRELESLKAKAPPGGSSRPRAAAKKPRRRPKEA
jgi:poly[(R)-3-hydroxyalkanoate] polymerase subunit PhaE